MSECVSVQLMIKVTQTGQFAILKSASGFGRRKIIGVVVVFPCLGTFAGC